MKIVHIIAKPQGMLIDAMNNHSRDDDDLDCILRDALRSSGAAAPEPKRVLASICERLAGERCPAHRPIIPDWPSSSVWAAGLYLQPLTRALR